jgi:DNA-binding response OmpR family regulator
MPILPIQQISMSQQQEGKVSTRVPVEKVLIVDSNENMAKCLAYMVEQFSVGCETASNGEDALKLLGSEQFKLVIADTKMPDMSGFGLLKHIKQRYPGLPVAITSTRNSELTQGVVVKSRADFYLPKPFSTADVGELLAKIE